MITESDKQLQCDFRHKSIIGARMSVEAASALLKQACAEKGKDAAVGFPDTAFYFP